MRMNLSYPFRHGGVILIIVTAINAEDTEVGAGTHVGTVFLQESLSLGR